MNSNTKFILIDINFVVQYAISLHELNLIFSKIENLIKKEKLKEKEEKSRRRTRIRRQRRKENETIKMNRRPFLKT